MISIGGTLGCTPSQHDTQQTFPVQLSRHHPWEHIPDQGAPRGGRPPIPLFPCRHGHADPGHVEMERDEGSGGGHPPVDPFDSPNLDIPSFSLGLTQPSQSLPGGSGTLHASPSQFRVCPISVTSQYIFRVFIISCTSSSGHSRFIYTASAYIAGMFI
ncbi:hypothetical protein M9H77_35493 [Catharanthus roseus]|uniref:Uncharacterized protein n=1 Tax=Catharanthus roseus TaxID=4058 RepID=A0ACB9ZPH7_CATRO|nr:hypothetical protein M9H77_35493 [Catharanthus roseus]